MCKYSIMRHARPIYIRKTWCWKDQLFPSPISPVVSQLLEVFHLSWNQIGYGQGKAYLTLWCCTSLHWFSAPVFAQPPRQQALCDGATFFKTASPTKDKRRSLRKQHIENHFPSIQKAPPEIPVKKWEQVGISKQHRNMSKHTAKNTAAYWIWYTSRRKQVYAHKTMQQYITPGKVWREQCCILTLLRFFSAIASWRQTLPELSPSSPMLCRCHRPQAGWVQAPEGQAGWKQLSSLTRGCGDWLLLSVVDKSPV